ncbi:MAG: GNAT family N-acetyltransferase [Lachnospiraceae bacterium]|nr:GNAT family N-acetyltransferase [Lachnospiraceae bacterium]
MVRLCKINEDNWLEFAGLRVEEDQQKFVASCVGILARGYAYRECRARVIGILAEDVPAGLALIRDLEEEPACYDLQQFMIDRRFQKKGVGTRALQLILAEMEEEHKYPCAEVCVKKADTAAIRLYEKAGFTDTGYIDEEVPDALNLRYTFQNLGRQIEDYMALYKNGGYIREMRKYVGHAPILTCACGVIIENDKGEILLQKRRDNGCWAIIGGSMEMGESCEEATRRETFEESGLTLGKLELFQLYSGKERMIVYPNKDVCFGPGIVFITREYSGTIVNDPEEVMEHRFFKKTELPENLNRYDKDIILEWAGR